MTRLLPLVLVLATLAPHAAAQPGPDTAPPARPDLQAELLSMAAADQAARQSVIEKGMAELDSAAVSHMAAVDEANLRRLRAIVSEHGWPGVALVGRAGSSAAFLLVQHAPPPDLAALFPMLEAAFAAGDLPGADYAAAADRVRVHRGEPQVYGTQVVPVNAWAGGRPAPYPIEAPEGVDERRAEMGLPPLEAYLGLIEETYRPTGGAGG